MFRALPKKGYVMRIMQQFHVAPVMVVGQPQESNAQANGDGDQQGHEAHEQRHVEVLEMDPCASGQRFMGVPRSETDAQ